jgi:hypothetical protein
MKPEAERVGKCMIRPVLALERLTFLEQEGKVGYRWGRDGAEQETEVMDYLEFIDRVTSHIPDKGQVMVRYYGLYANAHIYRSSEADVCGGEAPALMESLTLLPEYRPKRPPSHVFEQVALLEVEECGEYC